MGTLSLNASGLKVILAPRCGKNNVFFQYGLKFYIKMLAALDRKPIGEPTLQGHAQQKAIPVSSIYA